ncbi:TetR/AcrR family transcriptional regulator [Thermophilibacter provencensis]|uniref:TetR/AcrR family transcriptional regulator n=1 Tax=Thermophilibacter provencensis TaxID=1852386 RepID=A0ABT7V4Y3_9ACTN|nr:TetR/AcrR family transcriptional regulator [Thermophilibacter provencensis]MDM8271662.1 TetR/AcrR family transcriptional regulator [Thermophilibacter provencensis]HJA28303.1 TetR/AcrR family transcriptional regulator [Candidatus Olsenella pullicola]
MKKQPQVTEQTRANLRQAFWELYAERPVEKISVREITDRAGYNRATFYLYYHDVYELLEEIEETVLGNIERLVNERLLKGDKLDFSQHMGLILRLAGRSRDYTRVLLGPHGDPAFSRRLKEIISPLVDRFFLPAAELDEQARRVVREFYLSGILATIRTWTAEENPMPIDQLIQLVVRIVT